MSGWAAAAGAISSLGSSLITNAGNRKSQERANEWNIEQWHRQNMYNDPKQQMTRLKNAGLNPNLIYGTSPTSAVGNAEGVAPSKATEYKIDNPLRDISLHANMKNVEAQTDNLKEQSNVITQEANLKAAQTNKITHEGKSAKLKSDIDKELLQSTLDGLRESNRQKSEVTKGYTIDNTVKDKGAKDKLLILKHQAENSAKITRGTQLDNDIKGIEKELLQLGITRNSPQWMQILGALYNKLEKDPKFKF